MTVEHRFECVLCGHRVHGTGEESETARQHVREAGSTHLTEAHADRLASTPQWPDDPEPSDLLSGETAYGSLRGLLVPADDLLVCGDCGYYFGPADADPDRTPVGDAGLVCSVCYDRRVDDREEQLTEAITEFVK